MPEVHLKDYVWMRPPEGGPPEKVACDNDLISRRMVAGWAQVDPPKITEHADHKEDK
jgi:hypothetical protein